MATNRQTIAVIGASSMVGSRFCELQTRYNLTEADLNGDISVDITDKGSVNNFFKQHQFSAAILFSAYTDVNSAEKQRNNKNGACWQINVQGAENIAISCKQYGRKLILISTDFIFDGLRGPYAEIPAVNQQEEKTSWYGITKKYSEDQIMQLTDFLILRITYPYRANFNPKKDFARKILESYEQDNLHPLYTDQSTTPTFIDDVAPAVEILLENNSTGIFHVASPNSCSPYDFGKKLLEQFNKDLNKLKTSSLADMLKQEDSTPRPLKGGLKVEKLFRIGFSPTPWEDGIKKMFMQTEGKLI